MKVSSLGLALLTAAVTAGCAREVSHSTAEPVMASWRQDDRSKAIDDFLVTDWSREPLFQASSRLNLREDEFAAAAAKMNEGERKASLTEIGQLLQPLDQVGEAVVQAGLDAYAAGHPDEARRHFIAVKQCGQALSREDYTTPVKVLGVKFTGLASTKIAKLESNRLD